jgi:UDP-2,3-diacylglucosamine hydrolase
VTSGTWLADPAWRRIDLLSDVHLHPGAPRTFAAWRAYLLGTRADAVLILGDLFEAWVGDDARFDGFGADCAAVLCEASRHRAVAFMHGNRDFLVGPGLLDACGVQALDDPTLALAFGRRVLLTHGDALCVDDVDYQRFRRDVRSDAWRAAFLALPLGERLARARAMRDASAAHQTARPPETSAEVDDTLAVRWLADVGAESMVHGHTHRPGTHALPGGRVRCVLGDWDFDGDVPRALALVWTAEGLSPLDLAAP